MTQVRVIQVPYHLGHERVGMGAGPDALVEAGLIASLEDVGHSVEQIRVAPPRETANEIGASFEVLREVAKATRETVARGAFPLALAANCMTSIAVVAGLDREVGVVWLDAHPDFNTTEGTTSGFADGMGLAILTGTGWNALRETIPGYRAVSEERVALIGIRDIAPAEEERLAAAAVSVVRPDELDTLPTHLAALDEHVSDVYLHLDLDVLDPGEGRANEYAAAGGLSADAVEAVIDEVAERFSIRAASVTAYNPAADPEGRVPPIALRAIAQIVQAGTPVEASLA